MRRMPALIGFASVLTVLTLPASAAEARQDTAGFAIHEDWSTADAIRGDRWRGVVTTVAATDFPDAIALGQKVRLQLI